MAEVKLELGGLFDIASGSELKSLSDTITKGFTGLRKRDPRPLAKVLPFSVVQTNAGLGPVTLNFGGPASGRIWYIRQILMVLGDAFSTGLTAAVAGAAAGAATLTLPPGAILQQLNVVSTAAAGAVTTHDLEVAGGIGGLISLPYTFQTDAAGQQYLLNVIPGTPNTALTVTMPAVAGGSSYTLRASFDCPVSWYISQANGFNPSIAELIIPGTPIPMSFVPGDSDGLFLHFGESVVAQVNGLPLGQSVTGVVRIAESADSAEEIGRL